MKGKKKKRKKKKKKKKRKKKKRKKKKKEEEQIECYIFGKEKISKVTDNICFLGKTCNLIQ
jgi:hypothetical protein